MDTRRGIAALPAEVLDAGSAAAAGRGELATQDSTALETASTTVEQWQADIRQLLDPLPVLELSVRCPACSARYFHRHKDGERVRVSALQVTATGAACLACEHRWTPDTFVELARQLGVIPPTCWSSGSMRQGAGKRGGMFSDTLPSRQGNGRVTNVV